MISLKYFIKVNNGILTIASVENDYLAFFSETLTISLKVLAVDKNRFDMKSRLTSICSCK